MPSKLPDISMLSNKAQREYKKAVKARSIKNDLPKDGLTVKQRRTLIKKQKSEQCYALFVYYNDDACLGRDSSWSDLASITRLYNESCKSEPKTKFIIFKQTLTLYKA